jgi:hypothetical protein
MDRNIGLEYAEKSNKLGGSVCAGDATEIGFWVRTLMASRAWRTPITPTTGPKMPPSPQDTTASGGGGFGKIHR